MFGQLVRSVVGPAAPDPRMIQLCHAMEGTIKRLAAIESRLDHVENMLLNVECRLDEFTGVERPTT